VPPVPVAPPVAKPVAPAAAPPVRETVPSPPPRRPPAPAKKSAAAPSNEPPAISGYQDFYVVGEGGMGVVYRAWQPNLKRWVALKVLRSEALADPHLLARFKKEAQGIARLSHPNIVTLYSIDEVEGQPYLLLEYVDGGSLADRWNHAPQPPKEAAQLVEVLARAMQYAHEQKLVHRDLKPGNILLTRDGQPKITDFGLVKRLHSSLGSAGSDPEASLSLTMTSPGTIMGTPNYMAPEQIWGGSQDIDARVDVYALGAILYEGLTGRPPFRGATVHQTLDLVLNTQPKPPREIRPDIPSDIEAVCLKSIAKEAKDRYASAGDFADDLQRFLLGQPVLARRRRFHERAREWFHPRSLSSTTLSAVIVSLAVVLVVAIGFLVLERRQIDEARTATDRVQKEKDQSDRLAYAGSIGLAQRAWEEGRAGQALRLLEELRPGPEDADRRGWEWFYLHRLSMFGSQLSATEGWQPTAKGRQPSTESRWDPVRCIACSPDGQLLATGGDEGKVRLWDARTGKLRRTLTGHTGRVHRVAFGPDSAWLASGGEDHKVLVWQVDGGRSEPSYVYEKHEKPVLDVLFRADGQRIYSTASDGSVQDCDPRGQTPGQDLKPSGEPVVRRLAVGGTGSSRLYGATDEGIVVWTIGGAPADPRRFKVGLVRCLAASPDGKFLAVGTVDALQFWKLDKPDAPEIVRTFRAPRVPPPAAGSPTTSGPTELAFSADGLSLAAAGPDQVIRVWDCSPGRLGDNSTPKRTFRGHDRAVTGVCFNPTGGRLFSASVDQAVKAWDLTAPPEPLILPGGPLPVRALAFGPGGRLAMIGDDQMVRFWAGGKPEVEQLGKHDADSAPPAAVDVSFSPDGKRIASAASDKTARLWDVNGAAPVRAGAQEEILPPNSKLVTCVCFDPSGKHLAMGDNDGGVRLWDVARTKAKEIRSFKGLTGNVVAVAFGADGKRLAAAADRTVKVWDSETGKELQSLEGHEGPLRALAFSLDGKFLATGGDDETARLWEVESSKPPRTLEGHAGPVTGVAFSPDGRRLATAGGGTDATVRLWDVETGRELLQLAGAGRCVAFSSDGKYLAAADSSGQVLLWTAGSEK
jgi:WD40 repeat protein/serine/threonine protein kinase